VGHTLYRSCVTNTPTTPIPDKTRYLHYDNLGSIDTITDGQGNIVERMSYAAFGERRKGDWRASDPLSGDGGVITTSCLHFLVTASIRTVGEGCRVCAFSELLWFVEGCPSNGFIATNCHSHQNRHNEYSRYSRHNKYANNTNP
jgi:hypothetical protein